MITEEGHTFIVAMHHLTRCWTLQEDPDDHCQHVFDWHKHVLTEIGKGGDAMIDFGTIQIGDRVKVVGMGAPGFAQLDDVLTITRVRHDRVWARTADGQEAFFALTCGASRLERVIDDPGRKRW